MLILSCHFRHVPLAIALLWAGALHAAPPIRGPAEEPDSASGHWAFQPLEHRDPPQIQDRHTALTPIDAFLLARLETRGLSFSAPASRRALIRRASYDLIGVPPTIQEINVFEGDESPDAYPRLIERLLASPKYGERWGRHWLDVARYAETKDIVLVFGKDRLRPYAYTYRDYVIRAFNDDTPFDQFIREQIAADQIEPKVARWRLAALGFLTLGRLYGNNPHDQIDDQIDTVTRGMLGLTVACARCHDHKYDPISMADYYGLYGVFASSERPYDLPLIEDPDQLPGGTEFEEKLAEARRALQSHIDAEFEKLLEATRQRLPDYLVRVATTEPDLSETVDFFLSLSPQDLRPPIVSRWRRLIDDRANSKDSVFGLWADLMSLAEEDFAAQARERLKQYRTSSRQEPTSGSETRIEPQGSVRPNPMVLRSLRDNSPLTNKAAVARTYGSLLKQVYLRSCERSTNGSAAMLSAAERELLNLVTGSDSPATFPKSEVRRHLSRVEKDKLRKLVLKMDKLGTYAASAPPARAMVVRDTRTPYEPRIFLRGNPTTPGDVVPRTFLRALAGQSPEPFKNGSGRLELANAIADPNNPVTARVFVNRVWMHHLGEPLVDSPADFGARSSPPTHPKLLDWLAWRFVHEGWSLKKLHRHIMLSAVYQQSSADNTAARSEDPDNKLLWRFHRRRLDWEALRDTLLFVSSRLDSRMFGRSENIARAPLNCRRTVYGTVDRQDLPQVFRAFDFAVPDACVERRPNTTVPQQALFALNAPFVLEQARTLAALPDIAGSGEPNHRISLLYQKILSRTPEAHEVAQALRFVDEATSQASAADTFSPWSQLAQVLLMSNELIFID